MPSKIFIRGSVRSFENTISYDTVDFSQYSGDDLIPLVDTMTKAELLEYYKSFCSYYSSKENTPKDTKMFSFGNVLWQSNTTLEFLDYLVQQRADITINKDNYSSADLVVFDRESLVDVDKTVEGSINIEFAINKKTGNISFFGSPNHVINKKLIYCIVSLGLSVHYADYFSGTFVITTTDDKIINIHDVKFGFTTNMITHINNSGSEFFG